jgi:putative membrane protein
MGNYSSYFSGGHGMMRGNMFGMGFFWWILIVVAIIAVIYLLKNRTSQQEEQGAVPNQYTEIPDSHKNAFDLLDEEFAKGTITEEEYLRKKELLKK